MIMIFYHSVFLNLYIIFYFRNASHYLFLNSTFICASSYLEKSFVSPIIIPGIRNQPISSILLDSPPNYFDRMATQICASNVMINSTFVSQKILVNIKRGFYWAICYYFSLNINSMRRNRVYEFCIVQICFIIET